MTHIKCSQCGLNNWDGAEVCERCGVSLDNSPHKPVATPPAQPDFPVLFTFGAEPPRRSRTLKVIVALVITLAVGGGAWAVYTINARSSKEATGNRKQLVEPTVDERTRDARPITLRLESGELLSGTVSWYAREALALSPGEEGSEEEPYIVQRGWVADWKVQDGEKWEVAGS